MVPNLSYRKHALVVSAGIVCICFSCITRNNPWDPINGCHPEIELPEIQLYYQKNIDAIKKNLPLYDSRVTISRGIFYTLMESDSITETRNRQIIDSILQIITGNTAIAQQNTASGDCETSVYKDSIKLVVVRMRTGTSDSVRVRAALLYTDRHRIDSIFMEAEALCPGRQVFTPGFPDSLLLLYSNRLSDWDALIDSIDRYNNAITDSNRVVDSINHAISMHDSLVGPYNDSLRFCKLPRLSDPVLIKQRLDSITAGDTLALDAGTLSIEMYLPNKGSAGNYIVILGAPGGKTVIDQAERVEIEGSTYIKFENLVFNRMQNQAGARVWNRSSFIQFNHCSFSNNTGYGLHAFANTTNLTLTNCVFTGNGNSTNTDSTGQAGIRIENCRSVTLKNILAVRNAGIGIDIDGSQVDLDTATVSDNTLYGLRYSGSNNIGTCALWNTVFSYNGSYGIYRNAESTTTDVIVPATRNNRFYLNGIAEMGGDIAIANANKPFISNEDPMFADKEHGDYHIGSASPLFGKGIGYQYP